MAKAFTFKKEPRPPGLMSVGWIPSTDIKRNGVACGLISYNRRHRGGDGKWEVGLQIIKDSEHDDGNPNCEWMWIWLAERFDSEPEARKWLLENSEAILGKFKLHTEGD